MVDDNQHRTMIPNQEPTARIACKNCGVVQETTFSNDDEDEFAVVPTIRTADGECAVCEEKLTGNYPGIGGPGVS